MVVSKAFRSSSLLCEVPTPNLNEKAIEENLNLLKENLRKMEKSPDNARNLQIQIAISQG